MARAIIGFVTQTALVGVCGPVGAGKSTVAGRLALALGFSHWPERVSDNPFFRPYTQSPAKWAFLSQLAFVLGSVQDAAAARRRPPGGVLERPTEEMVGVFAPYLRTRGLLDDHDCHSLQRVGELGEELAGLPDVLVVLHGKPEVLLSRIRERARPGEEMYDLAELRSIDDAYSQWRPTLAGRAVIDIDVEAQDLRHQTEIEVLTAQVRSALSGRSALSSGVATDPSP